MAAVVSDADRHYSALTRDAPIGLAGHVTGTLYLESMPRQKGAAAQGALFALAPPVTQSTTFANNMALPVHRWFRYSAGFSAGWAQELVTRFDGRRVLDPFGGSGTTLLAAQSAGAESIGVDVHPFVARIAKAKLLWNQDPARLRDRSAKLLEAANAIESNIDPSGASELTLKVFPYESLRTLLSLRFALPQVVAHDEVDELLWLAIVAILRRCSPVGTAQWQYVLPNKSKAKVAEPVEAFRQQIELMATDMQTRRVELSSPAAALFSESDIRSTADVPDGWADLVVTSPPYANNFDYADATRLEMTFMGEITGWGDLKPLREKLVRSCSQQMVRYQAEDVLESAEELEPFRDEIKKTYTQLDEIRLTKGGRKAYHSMIVAYFHDMGQTWKQLRAMTSRGANVCFVVGDSAPYGIHVPVDRWLGEQALAAGFRDYEFEKVRDRNVKWENRKHRVPLHEGRLWVKG